VDAVAQCTKTGFVFLLDRDTGKPLFDVEERAVQQSKMPGEKPSPTQPFPVKPPPFARQSMTRAEITTVTPESRKECLALAEGAEIEGTLFRPLTDRPTVYFPGTNGGSNWGGGSFDPATGTLYVNSMDVGAFMKLVKRPDGAKIPYRAQGFGRFWDSNRYPCQQPPWGSLTAIDLNKGEIRWRAVLGEYDELTARGIPKTGASNLGGSMVTAGGLVFIGATNDSRFRAFDKDTGEEIWNWRLPASAHATPITFTGAKTGRQIVVIAAGGGNKYNANAMAKLIAFAVPGPGDPREPTIVRAPPRSVKLNAEYAGAAEKLPMKVAAQPAAFSHKTHARLMKCLDCHAGATSAEQAGFPAITNCRRCHEQQFRNVKELSWTRVYEVPDFVFFSHATHAKAGAQCSTCHGPVEQRDVLAKEVSTSMTSCIPCHRERKARVDCAACHHLGQ
jgi:hypothetical protein